MEITIKDLLNKVRSYNPDAVAIVEKAYDYAANLHEGQLRQSGEPYITHPLNVAYILAEMHADCATLCAALLHDTLEDTRITKEDIICDFGLEVGNLVDGVTKLAKMNFSSKEEQHSANTRKIITSITEDVRIVIIKLADRLHNMRTLEFKTEFKQKENAMETMDIFVPMAYYIGAYRIKSELEDISLKYLYPEDYKRIESMKQQIEYDSKHCLEEMLGTINQALDDKKIHHFIKRRTKNIYGIYKKVYEEGYKVCDIHDLLSLKIMVDDISDCYQTLGIVHSKYNPINEKFKDYIYNPKTNMYRSLHTTVFGPDERRVQTQIRTFDMDKIASYGLTAYWAINKGQARYIMQEDLKNKTPLFKSLMEMNRVFGDNQEFVAQVKKELFSKNIYVYNTKGEAICLPVGATPVDFAYEIEQGEIMVGAYVNDEYVPVDYTLKNKDRIRIATDNLSYGPRTHWLECATTTKARQKILNFDKN